MGKTVSRSKTRTESRTAQRGDARPHANTNVRDPRKLHLIASNRYGTHKDPGARKSAAEGPKFAAEGFEPSLAPEPAARRAGTAGNQENEREPS